MTARLDSYWKAGNTAVSTKEIRNQWSTKENVRDTSESRKQVDWRLINKAISPLQGCGDLPSVGTAPYTRGVNNLLSPKNHRKQW